MRSNGPGRRLAGKKKKETFGLKPARPGFKHQNITEHTKLSVSVGCSLSLTSLTKTLGTPKLSASLWLRRSTSVVGKSVQAPADEPDRRKIKTRFNTGMSTSSNMSIQTHDTRFQNKTCYCHLRAAVRISESEKNPGKLYYECPKEKDKKCKFWDWCNPIGYGEPNSAVEAHVQLRSNDDARLRVIEIHVANLKHIVNIIVFFCGLALVVSVMTLVK